MLLTISIVEMFVLSACSMLVSGLISWGYHAGLRRTVKNLEYCVADLESRIVREVKKRAGESRVSKTDAILDELEQLKAAGNSVPKPRRFDFAGALIAKRQQAANGVNDGPST